MNKFEVLDMSCGHCVSTITRAIRAVDAGARVEIDLASHRVSVEPTEADAQELADAIREAGYSPRELS
jgi:copper chaperone